MHALRSPEQTLVAVWAITCLLGGVGCVMAGARATGLALLGALAGAFAGSLVTSDFDSIPNSAAAGASIGTIVVGALGMLWRPTASSRTLFRLGAVLLGLGLLATALIGSMLGCATDGPCLSRWEPGHVGLFALDSTWVAILCLAQGARQCT